MSVKLCKMVKDELLRFTDAIEAILEEKGIKSSDIVYVRVFIMGLSAEMAMNHVIEKILPWEPQIESRQEKFFQDNLEIFGRLPQDRVSYFYDLVQSGKLDQEDKDEIWDFFSAFVEYAKEYKKRQ